MFGRLFGTDTAIKATIDTVKAGLDKLVYTEEERVQDSIQERKEARAAIIQWISSTQGQNLARRIIALSITSVWLGQFVLSQIIGCISIFYKKAELSEVSSILLTGAKEINSAIMLILAFYFAAPHMNSIAQVFLKRKE